MKKIICCLIIILTFLCGCDKKPEKVEDNNEVLTESTSEVTGGHYVDPNAGMGIFLNINKVNIDEITGEVRYSSFLDDVINYDGSKIELGIDMSIESGSNKNEVMKAMVMMVVDKELIPFTIDGSEEKIVHNLVFENSVITRKLVGFSAYNLEKGEEKEWTFLLVPVLDEYRQVVDEIIVGECKKKIISTVEKTDIKDEDFCDKGYCYDTAKNIYGKEIDEICEYNGIVTDYILQDNDNKWYFMSDSHYGGEIVVMLFNDGELYEGFNGKSSLCIEKTVEGQQVHMEIDTSKLGEGEYHMSAIVLAYGENGKLERVNKALVLEHINKKLK